MRIERTDPITGRTLADLEGHPYIVQGEGPNALKIYFESEESRRIFLDIEFENPDGDAFTLRGYQPH